ncbi:MAG: LPS export ABC transporter periplasmic protein LptC [Bacteroidales bacterium]|jgi:LPS export ABC transporter protein LptC|nr:LPS export ABC transporter periplasmic protein LptC [Bacteroidales bacterium]
MQRKLFFSLAVMLSVILSVVVSACKNDIAVVKSLTVKEKSPSETGTKMHLYFSEAGVLKNEFLFEKVNKYNIPESYLEYPEGLEIIAYDVNREKEMSLTAGYGISYEDKKIMETKYNVVITNFKTKEIIETEHLIWDMNKHLVYSNTQTKQTRPDGSVSIGDRFESDESLTKYTVFNPHLILYADEE